MLDVLDDILLSLRLNGGVVFDVRTHGDWCVISQFEREHCVPYFPVPERIISYHYVRKGRMFAQLSGHKAIEAREGEMILFPRNDPHLCFTRAGLTPIDIADYMNAVPSGPLNRITMDFGGEAVDLYCGWLGVIRDSHPLLDALPPMLHIGRDAATADWTSTSLRVAAGDWNASPAMVAKLSALFFAHAVRRYIAGLGNGEGGWLAGLRDPAVGRALGVIHARYAHDLDIDTLAREAGVSRTVLGERFAQLLGEPPMRYCARWRLRVAAGRLLDGEETTASIAYSIGFASEAAFNRAFKREYGEPPATWKRNAEKATTIHAAAA